MSAEITIRLGSDDFRDFVSMLGDGTHLVWRRILKQIGLILTSSAQEAFEEERLGDIEWPARYPNQTEPYANIAGIVSDLGKGKTPPDRRFDNRPVLRDSGELFGSIDERGIDVRGFGVTVSSDKSYADIQHSGGKSYLLVDGKVRRGLVKLLEKKPELRSRLGWLFSLEHEDMLETEVNARPFFGITDKGKARILDTIDRNLTGRPWE